MTGRKGGPGGPGATRDTSGGDFDLSRYMEAQRERVEAGLERTLEALGAEMPGEVRAAAAHGVRGGGKRLRPILCVAAFQAAGGGEGGQALYDLAASLELIHAYSLMHDDLPCMDDADLRRGRPTTHRVHGVSTTTVAGTALIPLAVRHAWVSARALGCEPAQAGEVARTLARAAGAGGMVGGQALDLLGEERRLAGEELDKLHRLKTGALLTAALRMGSLAAGAPERVRTGLEAFGDHIGLAFQIADDILDATSSAEELGKNPSDEELGKSTYVSLHGLGSARARGEREVEQARSALARAQVVSPALDALARYVLERRR